MSTPMRLIVRIKKLAPPSKGSKLIARRSKLSLTLIIMYDSQDDCCHRRADNRLCAVRSSCVLVLSSWHVETVLQMRRASHTEHRSIPGNQGTNDAEPASNTEQDTIINCKLSYSQKDVRYEKQAKNGNKQAIRSH